jgi:hypothetical protein
VYDKPLFTGTSAASIYRPKNLDDDLYGGSGGAAAELEKLTSENRFVPERGFSGTESTAVNTQVFFIVSNLYSVIASGWSSAIRKTNRRSIRSGQVFNGSQKG